MHMHWILLYIVFVSKCEHCVQHQEILALALQRRSVPSQRPQVSLVAQLIRHLLQEVCLAVERRCLARTNSRNNNRLLRSVSFAADRYWWDWEFQLSVKEWHIQWVTSLFGLVRGWAFWLSPNTNLNAPLRSKSRPEISLSSAELLLKIVTKRYGRETQVFSWCATRTLRRAAATGFFKAPPPPKFAYLQPAFVHCI